MRILIVTGIFPPDIGGPATYVPQIATALAERGHQLTVLTLCDDVDGHDDAYPFRVVRLPRRLFKPWRWLLTVVRLIQEGHRADVLFVIGLALEAVLANILLRKPMVQKVVGDSAWERAANWSWVKDPFEDFQKQRHETKVEILKVLRAWWTRRADRVIVPSQYLAGWVRGWGVRQDRITVIYNAVELSTSSRPAGEGHKEGASYGNSGQPPRIPLSTLINVVTVGRLVPWKHVDKTLEAVARVDGVGLVIIGDGPERGRLGTLACSLGLEERSYFAGARTKAETLALMAACDIFVLNSTYEGFPHVVLEAMGLGLPVVATAVGGTPELVENRRNGRLIPPADGEALQDVLRALASCLQERQHLADGARDTVKRFHPAQMVGETLALIEITVRQRGGKSVEEPIS